MSNSNDLFKKLIKIVKDHQIRFHDEELQYKKGIRKGETFLKEGKKTKLERLFKEAEDKNINILDILNTGYDHVYDENLTQFEYPLREAVITGDKELVEYLLDHGSQKVFKFKKDGEEERDIDIINDITKELKKYGNQGDRTGLAPDTITYLKKIDNIKEFLEKQLEDERSFKRAQPEEDDDEEDVSAEVEEETIVDEDDEENKTKGGKRKYKKRKTNKKQTKRNKRRKTNKKR